MNTIINNLPVGVTLALEVGNKEKFISRYIVTSEPATIGTINQHLLDGQQRLTAFWYSMHNNYESETFFVYLPEFDQRETKYSDEIEVYCQGRWHSKDGRRVPLWADDPVNSLYKGFIPIHLLCPGDLTNQVDKCSLNRPDSVVFSQNVESPTLSGRFTFSDTVFKRLQEMDMTPTA